MVIKLIIELTILVVLQGSIKCFAIIKKNTNQRPKMMQPSKLHATGKEDYLDVLKNEYISLKNQIIGDPKLTELELKKELENASHTFKKQQKNSVKNLY